MLLNKVMSYVSLAGVVGGIVGCHYATRVWQLVVLILATAANSLFLMHWMHKVAEGSNDQR